MKRILVVSVLILSGRLYCSSVTNVTQDVKNVISLINGLLESPVARSIPDRYQNSLTTFSYILTDSYNIILKSGDIVQYVKQFEERAIKLKTQFSCIAIKSGAADVIQACTLVGCSNRKACIAATLEAIRDFLQPLVESVLGRVTGSGKDVKIDPGILLVAAHSKLLPAEKSERSVKQLADYAVKMSKALDFLSLVSFMINPVITPVGMTDKQAEAIKEDPIVVQEEELSFED